MLFQVNFLIESFRTTLVRERARIRPQFTVGDCHELSCEPEDQRACSLWEVSAHVSCKITGAFFTTLKAYNGGLEVETLRHRV